MSLAKGSIGIYQRASAVALCAPASAMLRRGESARQALRAASQPTIALATVGKFAMP